MNKIKGFVFLFVLAFAGIAFGYAETRKSFVQDNGYYLEMPILIYNIAEKKYEGYSNENLKNYLSESVYVSTDKKDKQKFEKEYTKNNTLEIKVDRVEFSTDGKYAYVYAFLKAYLIPLKS